MTRVRKQVFMSRDTTVSELDTMQVLGAFAVLKTAFHADPTYAWEWQCALVESQRAVGVDPKQAHQGAAHFLLKHFGVNVPALQVYKDLMQTWH
jgi:hypothetical protein